MTYRHGFLIATQFHQEEPFLKSVIYVCEHSSQGSFGLILNKPLDIDLGSVLKNKGSFCDPQTVFMGGLMQSHERGFILHRDFGQVWQGTTQLDRDLFLTSTQDLLLDLNQYPVDRYRIFIGFLTWLPGQLEYELAQSIWLYLPYDDQIIFSDYHSIWRIAYEKLGFTPEQLGCVDPGARFTH